MLILVAIRSCVGFIRAGKILSSLARGLGLSVGDSGIAPCLKIKECSVLVFIDLPFPE
jgi:hypothetical protein